MNVILEMLNQGSPIYTVHDNFITTADHSKKLPDTYVNIFCKMDPLSIINEYIYHNVIDYQEKWLDGGEFVYDEKGIDTENWKGIIKQEDLKKYLYKNIPEKQKKKKKDRDTWEQKIQTIMTSYENYVNFLCEPFDKSLGKNEKKRCFSKVISKLDRDTKYQYYREKLMYFRNHLSHSSNHLSNSSNYSVHY